MQQQLRTVTSQFIADILALPRWKSDKERIIVYANLHARLTDDTSTNNHLIRARNLAAQALSVEISEDFNTMCHRCNKMVHGLLDDEQDYLWNEDGKLSEKWDNDIIAIAAALLVTAPPPFMPTAEPQLIGQEHTLTNDVPLVKNGSKQTRKTMPKAIEAMDVLYSQGYRLNPDIMNLKNLPIALDVSKNYAAKQVALQHSEEFSGEFFFQYTLDSRGRINARSRIVTPQGASFDKAVLNFSEAKPLGQYGLQALMIHYANVSGHDKMSFKDRMKWARTEGTSKAKTMYYAKGDWINILPHIEDKKHCFEEYAAAINFFNAIIQTNPEQYMSALVTHQDATNSGFQFGAALTGDRTTAEEVNLTSTKTSSCEPADLYKKMAYNLQHILQGTGLLKHLPAITRTFVKTAIMVTGYGAGIKAVMRDINKEQTKLGIIIPEEILERLQPHVKLALEETASSMLELTNIIRTGIQDLDSPEVITWTTPDGFVVKQTYRDNTARLVKLNKYLSVHVALQDGEVDPIDDEKMATSLPPNFIHSIDAQMVRSATINASNQNIALSPIHDSFGTHAATFFDLNVLLKLAFIETMQYDWYGNLCKSNNMKEVNIRTGDYKAEECLKAVYMFS